ncbi:hypothetical protein N9K86_03625 [Litoricolaceae bacterium]|nr:hypothetical protein [Litorivicinaceae bacterium]
MSLESDNARLLVQEILVAEKPHYKATLPLLAYSTRSLGNAFSNLEDELMPDVIKAKQGDAHDNHRRLLRLILLNLVGVGFSHEHLNIQTKPEPDSWIHNKYGLDQRRTKRLVDALLEHKLMFKSLWGNRHAKMTNAYRPTANLLLPYAEFLYQDHGNFDDYEPIKLSGEDYTGSLEWFPDLERNREILRAYNAMMSAHTWARKDVTHRSFNDTPFSAGRVHTPYQTIVNRRVPIRKKTLLDGQPIVEPDFTANHLTLLSMIFNRSLPDSPYDRVADDTGISKDVVKTVLVRLMGAQNEQGYNQSKYTLERSKDKVSRTQVNAIRQSFYRCIPFLKEHNLLCTGWGGRLQFIEGETALAMFEWATETNTPILNIHDSFACKKEDEERVSVAMYSLREGVLNEWGSAILRC